MNALALNAGSGSLRYKLFARREGDGPTTESLLKERSFDRIEGHATVEAVLLVNPVAAALQASEMPGFKDYELLPLNWWIVGSACVALLVFLVVRTWRLCRPE